MGYSGNYTGYSVTGLDVFYWILLTGGSLGFPIIVLTICCIRRHCKDQDNAHELLYGEPMLKKKRGIAGPYYGSQENMKYEQPKRTLPEITRPTLLDESQFNIDRNIHVRFKDDSNDSYNHDTDGNDDYTNIDTNTSDLRGLKEAVSFFSKRPVVKPFKVTNTTLNNNTTSQIISEIENILPQVNMHSNRYVSERITRPNESSYRNKPNESSYRVGKVTESSYRVGKTNEASYRVTRPNESSYRANQTVDTDKQNSVFAISDSYRLPIASRVRNQQPLSPQPEKTVSIENIYSQVLVSTNRNNFISETQESDINVSINDSQQPVYMNTSQFNAEYENQQNLSISSSKQSNRSKLEKDGNWDDSCV